MDEPMDKDWDEMEMKLVWLEQQLEMLVLAVRDLKGDLARRAAPELLPAKETRVQQTIGEGHANLVRLYGEGYHICPLHFGSQRQGEECLFCAGLLQRHGGAEEDG